MKQPQQPSIRDVAELAGVSVGSASRVINEAANVTDSVRERVLRAIAELNYRPNHAAQSLRLRASRTVGCLMADVTNQIYGQMFHALEDRFRRAGYVTLIANSLHSTEREVEILNTFRGRGIDALVIAPVSERDPTLTATLSKMDIPLVILNSDIAVERDRIQFDYLPGIRAAVDYVVQLGHRRIAMVLSEAGNRSTRKRMEALRTSMASHGLTVDEALIVRLPTSMSSSFPAVTQLLEHKERPTVIFALSTNILLETLNAIARLGLRIPEDISVIAMGDPSYARNYTPALSSIRIDHERVAEHAETLLLDKIQGETPHAARTVSVSADFVIRQSCAPLGSG